LPDRRRLPPASSFLGRSARILPPPFLNRLESRVERFPLRALSLHSWMERAFFFSSPSTIGQCRFVIPSVEEKTFFPPRKGERHQLFFLQAMDSRALPLILTTPLAASFLCRVSAMVLFFPPHGAAEIQRIALLCPFFFLMLGSSSLFFSGSYEHFSRFPEILVLFILPTPNDFFFLSPFFSAFRKATFSLQ